MVVAAGWWVAAVMLTPAASRPYVGGSTNDSILQLALGYNGLGRLDGNETGSVGFTGRPAVAAARRSAARPGWGGCSARIWAGRSAGCCRPRCWPSRAGLAGLAGSRGLGRGACLRAGHGRSGRQAGGPRPRRDVASVLLWGGWLLVTGGVFSFMAGIIHPYYTVALAPAIGALVGIGAVAPVAVGPSWPAGRCWPRAWR